MSDDKSEVPGPSTAEDSVPDVDAQETKASKVRIKSAYVYCGQLLEENDQMSTETPTAIEQESIEIGKEMYQSIRDVIAEKTLVTEDELIAFDEIPEEGLWEEVEESVTDESQPLDEADDYEPPEKMPKAEKDFIPLDYKIKVVNLAKANPGWSLQSLQRRGAHRLKKKSDLQRWEEQIRKGGTTKDKYNTIDSWVNDRFTEARQCNQQVTTRNLQQWALAAASQFPELKFKAGHTWTDQFKARHRIRQRKITKFVSERETVTMEETLAAAENFRVQARAVIPNYDKDFVINTDQTGIQKYNCSTYPTKIPCT